MARYYSKLACERREALTAALEKEVTAQRIVQDIVENAPGIAFLMLSGDMRAMVLYANKASASVLRLDAETLPGRYGNGGGCRGRVDSVIHGRAT